MGNWNADGKASAMWGERQLRALMDKECALMNEGNPSVYQSLPRAGIADKLRATRAQIDRIKNEGQ